MKKLLITLAALASLSACSYVQSPQQKYYVTVTAETEAGNVASSYVDACKSQPTTSTCYAKLPAINKAAKQLQTASKALDDVFVNGNSQYYDLNLTVTQNAINDLKKAIN